MRLSLLLSCVLLAAGSAPAIAAPAEGPSVAAPPPPDAGPRAETRRLVGWRCGDDGRVYTDYRGAGEPLVLVTGEERWTLPARATREGALWASRDARFHLRQGRARLQLGDRDSSCERDPLRTAELEAEARSVRFRASGFEPGWLLEIGPQRMVWETDYGSRRFAYPQPRRVEDPEASQTWWLAEEGRVEEGGDASAPALHVAVGLGPCFDAAGRSHPARVTLLAEGRRLRGCGRWLDADVEATGDDAEGEAAPRAGRRSGLSRGRGHLPPAD